MLWVSCHVPAVWLTINHHQRTSGTSCILVTPSDDPGLEQRLASGPNGDTVYIGNPVCDVLMSGLRLADKVDGFKKAPPVPALMTRKASKGPSSTG